MRRFLLILLLLGGTALGADPLGEPGRIVKTLPLFLDSQGRDAVSPSLFDRDAYQAYLRDHPKEVSALRFDSLWQVKPVAGSWKLRGELRAIGEDGKPQEQTLTTEIHPPYFRHWDSLTLGGTNYQTFGRVVAWRTTLWHNNRQISEQKSFLW